MIQPTVRNPGDETEPWLELRVTEVQHATGAILEGAACVATARKLLRLQTRVGCVSGRAVCLTKRDRKEVKSTHVTM